MDRETALRLPKIELHVHLEGSIQPGTLLRLAERHGISLPAKDLAGLAEWYTFTDFPHFVEIYTTLSQCIRTAEDIELITREFLQGQADQNIFYTEATYTPFTIFKQSGIPWDEQIDAINRGREWARKSLDVDLALIVDIVREIDVADGEMVADWVIGTHGHGVCALGLSGIEALTEPKKHAHAFATAKRAGVPISTHAGETQGPWSILGCLDDLGADRIGHGVRAVEDPALVERLRVERIPIEVCPSSNVCLKVFPTLADHTLPKLLDAGLVVTINSDDPPMFNTTLTDELVRVSEAFGLEDETVRGFIATAVDVAFVDEPTRASFRSRLG